MLGEIWQGLGPLLRDCQVEIYSRYLLEDIHESPTTIAIMFRLAHGNFERD